MPHDKSIEWVTSATVFRRRVGQFRTDIVTDGAILLLLNNTTPLAMVLSMKNALRMGIPMPGSDATVNQTFLKDRAGEVVTMLEEHGVVAIRSSGTVEMLMLSMGTAIEHGVVGRYMLYGPKLIEEIARQVFDRIAAERPHPGDHPVEDVNALIQQIVTNMTVPVL